MSFLAPLFLFGALAVALPVVFHLIRRTTREQTLFSSLMFLQPSPPRLTRKSRLEHLLLLLLRCLALALLAFGFARPFLKQTAANDRDAAAAKRIVVLLDTSASMRREGLWAAARQQAEAVLRKVTPADEVAVFTFDRQVTPLVSFDQWKAMPAGDRVGQALNRIGEATPGWSATLLGNALVRAAEELADDDTTKGAGPRQIVLISDLQEGSRLDQLQAYEWPKGIQVLVEPVKARTASNASVQLVTESADTDRNADPVVRVRVSNAADAKRERFQVGWTRPEAPGFVGAAVDVYVPPGQSRVVPVPAPTNAPGLNQIILRGDDEPFDNAVFVIPPEAARLSVLYLGAEAAEDTHQPLFFLRRALPETHRQAIQVIARPPAAALTASEAEAAALFVVTDALPDDRAALLRGQLLAGKIVIFAPKSAVSAPTLARLLGRDTVAMEEAKPDKYAMLADIDFRHPLFAPFADPRFSDFTKIHFWKYRRLEPSAIPEARIVARFDSGAPALLEAPVGKGRLLVLTSGWQPEDSQLALSSKFVPLLYSLLELTGGLTTAPSQYLVGDPVALTGPPGAALTLRAPDGTTVPLAAGATNFTQTRQPGIYALTSATPAKLFAVNLDPAESRTLPLSVDELEHRGAPVTATVPVNAAGEAKRQAILQSSEAESRQKLWRWLIAAALAVLVGESALAGWTARRSIAVEGTPA
jgi:hypothetical protein